MNKITISYIYWTFSWKKINEKNKCTSAVNWKAIYIVLNPRLRSSLVYVFSSAGSCLCWSARRCYPSLISTRRCRTVAGPSVYPRFKSCSTTTTTKLTGGMEKRGVAGVRWNRIDHTLCDFVMSLRPLLFIQWKLCVIHLLCILRPQDIACIFFRQKMGRQYESLSMSL